jgi:hypothetical protein
VQDGPAEAMLLLQVRGADPLGQDDQRPLHVIPVADFVRLRTELLGRPAEDFRGPVPGADGPDPRVENSGSRFATRVIDRRSPTDNWMYSGIRSCRYRSPARSVFTSTGSGGSLFRTASGSPDGAGDAESSPEE